MPISSSFCSSSVGWVISFLFFIFYFFIFYLHLTLLCIIALQLQGGWELDESKEDAAMRETLEEAGVTGKVEVSIFKSISDSISSEIFCQVFVLIQFLFLGLILQKILGVWIVIRARDVT
jgi:hypothetical protein